jgi:putative MFS transporter
LFLGGLADRFGRKPMFIVEMLIFVVFLCLLVGAPLLGVYSFALLIFCLFGVGLALGCDYPTAHLMISESIPSSDRGRLVLGAFGFQALGVLVGTVVGYLILANMPQLGAWRWMNATAIIPALLVAAGRFFITESGHWLLSRGQHERARVETARLLARDPPYPREIHLVPRVAPHTAHHRGYGALFKGNNLRATIFASVPWFLQDLGTYGIGIFTPTILAAALGHKAAHPRNVADLIANDELAAKGAALIDILLIVGIIFAILLTDRIGRIRLQIVGFIGCAAGLLLASLSAYATGTTRMALIFAGFMLFNFMTNMGPNAQTYLLAGEVFPTYLRGTGAGVAAAVGKVGAIMTAFLFPILLADIGTQALLLILVGTSLLGAVVTSAFRIETTGLSMEKIGH